MPALHGLYAITRPHPQLAAQVEQALRGGARVVQYRDKSGDHARRLAEATALRALCRTHDALLIVNDDVELAAEIGADGVHLGRDDAALARARTRLGGDAIIGVSCYDRLELARAAQDAGADYVAFGSFFPSPTKPDAAHADFALLRVAAAHLRVPVCAIGGITVDNAPLLTAAGADLIAVISGLFDAADVAAAARAYRSAFPA